MGFNMSRILAICCVFLLSACAGGPGTGVTIVDVAPEVTAAGVPLFPGDSIVKVSQESTSSPATIRRMFELAKAKGEDKILLLVANSSGELRFIAVDTDIPLDGIKFLGE